jgi:O-antigen/teichoic acid export membrane protein
MATHQGSKVFVLDIAFFGTNILLNLILVVVFKMNILGIILGILINAIFFGLILIPLFYRKFTFNYDRQILKSAMEYSIALIPNIFAGIALESIDKFFLNSYTGADNSGLYYIAITFAAIFSATKESIVGAFTPWFFGNISEGDESYLSKVISAIYIVLGVVALLLSWFSKEVLLLLSSNPDLVNSYKYIPINVLALFVIFLGQLYGMKILFYTKYVKYLVFTILVGIVVDIIACYFLVPIYGIHGAALSRVIAFFFHVMAILYLSHMEPEKRGIYNDKLLLGTLGVVTVLIGLPVYFADVEYIFLVKIGVTFIVLFITFVFLDRSFNLKLLYLTLYKKYFG